MTRIDFWGLLYDEDAFTRAENTIAASFGATANHQVMLGQFQRLSDWVFEDAADAVQISERFLHLVAAFVTLTRFSVEQFATLVETGTLREGESEPSEQDVREMMNKILHMTSENLRQQLG